MQSPASKLLAACSAKAFTRITSLENGLELIDRDKELARLNKEKAKAEKEMAMFANQLNNPKFVERAPAALVEDIRNKYAKSQDKLANIEQSIKALG